MPISDNQVVSIHYTLTNNDGEVLDSSDGAEPLTYLHGAGNIIPGLEDELVGKEAGDTLTAKITPENGYGPVHQQLIEEVPRSAFGDNQELAPGMMFQAETDQGVQMFKLLAVTEETVTLDGNHPLAGVELNFEVSIEAVRDATEEEIAHTGTFTNYLI